MANIKIVTPASPTEEVRAREIAGSPPVKIQRIEQADWPPEPINLASITSGQLAVQTTAVFLPNIPSDATHALISIENSPVRWSDTDDAPTAAAGHKLTADSYFWLAGRTRLTQWRAVRIAAPDATLYVTYYKFGTIDT
jgi:hypothetical protein